MVDTINQGYINSKLPVRVELHCIELADLHDNPVGGAMLNQFGKLKGSTEKLRQTADVALLLFHSFEFAGIAGGYISVVQKPYAFGKEGFTPGHEIGHIFGAGHDKLEVSSNILQPPSPDLQNVTIHTIWDYVKCSGIG